MASPLQEGLDCTRICAEYVQLLNEQDLEGDRNVGPVLKHSTKFEGLSHQDLAERLGVYRETVTNALNELKNANILNVGRKRITIVDRRRLERAAGE
jgi:CRP-like cAMP-binding protein